MNKYALSIVGLWLNVIMMWAYLLTANISDERKIRFINDRLENIENAN